MRCPRCDTPNEDQAASCTKCGMDFTPAQGRWLTGREGDATLSEETRAGLAEWDPANRYSEPRSTSVFVPPARYPDYLGWSIISLVLCFLLPAVFAYFLWRWYVAAVILCLLPVGVIALVCSRKVGKKQALGDEHRAFRYSQLAKFWCWVSFIIGLAFYVGVFMRLMYGIGELWGY